MLPSLNYVWNLCYAVLTHLITYLETFIVRHSKFSQNGLKDIGSNDKSHFIVFNQLNPDCL